MAIQHTTRLTGQSALVTGARSGLGRGTATALAQAGADVALLVRREGGLRWVAQEIARITGRRALPLPLDLAHFAAAGGAPTIFGTWIGAFTYSPFWTTVFFAVGIGAILQVVYEVGRLIVGGEAKAGEPALTRTTFGGVAAGVAVMYLTGPLVAG